LIAELVKELKAANILDGTTLVMTSDHGDMLHEHVRLCHQTEIYDELLRVPLIKKSPAVDGHRIIDRQFSLMDLALTTLVRLNIERPKTFQAESILRLLKQMRARGIVICSVRLVTRAVAAVEEKGNRNTESFPAAPSIGSISLIKRDRRKSCCPVPPDSEHRISKSFPG
jgi:hypothetical protein